MECIVHFGMHKTGSTSIQKSLYHGRLPTGIQYVSFERPNSSAALATMYLENPEEFYFNRRRGFTEQQLKRRSANYKDKFSGYLLNPENQKLIISSEDLNTLPESVVKGLNAQLQEGMVDARAVGYIRKPRSFLNSAFQEQVKHGRRGFNLDAMFPKYKQRFEKFDSVFGKERTTFWLFDPATFYGNDVVLDFCNRIGVPFASDQVRKANEGISLPALKLLYAYRKFSPKAPHGEETVRSNGLLLAKLHELNGPKMTLASSLTDPFVAAYRGELDWMEERLGQSLEEANHDVEGSIRSEKDLLTQDPLALEWLMSTLGTPRRKVGINSPKQVASHMQALRDKLLAEAKDSDLEANAQ